jgi:protein TonB
MDHKEYLDILFKGFEKKYGSYRARQVSGLNAGFSFLVTVLFFSVFLISFIPREKKTSNVGSTLKVNQKKVVKYSQLSAPPPIEMVDQRPPKRVEPAGVSRPVASKKFVKPTIKPDEEVTEVELLPSQEELKYINPGTKNQEGDSLHQISGTGDDLSQMEIQYDISSEVEIVAEEEVSAPPKQVIEEPEEEVLSFVEEQAEFPGGVNALYKFLSDNLTYPNLARENQIEGRVIMQFVVEKDGSISNIEVLRDIGGGCGSEAGRVIAKMPSWKPAIQNNNIVRSRFTLPVRFTLQNN